MSLMLHCGSQLVSRDELRSVPCPSGEGRWKPVPHGTVADTIFNELSDRGLKEKVESEEWGLNQSQTQMFGVIRFQDDNGDGMTKSIGVRNSINKTLSVGIIASYRLLVCDNLMFACGEDGVKIEKRHTIGLDVKSIVWYALDNIESSFDVLSNHIELMKSTKITDDRARVICCKAAEMRAIRPSHITKALSIYFNPIHAEFRSRTLFSLYNSLNEMPKEYGAQKAFYCHQKLADLFKEVA